MGERKRGRFGLPVGVAATVAALLLLAVPVAQATTVTPINDPITVENTTPTDFIPANAYSPTGLRCYDVTAEFEVKGTLQNFNRNINDTGEGALSTGPGSVSIDMSDNGAGAQAPIFDDCWVRDFSTSTDDDPAFVTTSGIWTIAAIAGSPDRVAVGVPASGAIIDIPAQACEIDVSNDGRGSSVLSVFTDGDQSNLATIDVDGQIDFSGCNLPTPAGFEGSLEMESTSGTPVEIN